MIDKDKITLIATFAVAFFTYTFWHDVKVWTSPTGNPKDGISIFYWGIGLAFVGYTYVAYRFCKRLSKYEKRLGSLVPIAHIIFLSTVNNMVDELIFDPTKRQLNEYIGFVLIIVITYWKPIVEFLKQYLKWLR